MSGWNFRKTLGLLGGLVRLTATRRGVGASVGRGPVRVGRGADGSYRATVRVGPFWKTVPLRRARPGAGPEGAWPASEGAPLTGPGPLPLNDPRNGPCRSCDASNARCLAAIHSSGGNRSCCVTCHRTDTHGPREGA